MNSSRFGNPFYDFSSIDARYLRKRKFVSFKATSPLRFEPRGLSASPSFV
jgi:hypothetical protein